MPLWSKRRFSVLGATLLALPACSGPLTADQAHPAVTVTTGWSRAVNADVDMLYVIDSSAASADWQAKVAAQLPLMMTTASQCQIDGALPNIHSATVVAPDGQLLARLQPALAGTLRPDAALGVVLVTGADDASPGDVSTYVAALSALKTDPQNQIVVMGVIGAASPRIMAMAEAFPNNTLISIDQDSFSPVMTALCVRILPLRAKPCLPVHAQDCAASETLTSADGVSELVIPACTTASQETLCWSAAPDLFNCPQGGQALTILNQPTGSNPAHYSVNGTISCQVEPSSP